MKEDTVETNKESSECVAAEEGGSMGMNSRLRYSLIDSSLALLLTHNA